MLERRIACFDARDFAGRRAGVERQQLARMHFAVGNGIIRNLDPVFVLAQPDVVANTHLRQDDADIGRHALPHGGDSRQQIAAILGAGELHEGRADFDFHRIDGQKIFDPLFLRLGGVGFGLLALLVILSFCLPREHQGQRAAAGAECQQRQLRQTREHQNAQKARRNRQRPRITEELRHEFGRQIALLRTTRDQQPRGQRHEKRRHLTDQAVADRELGKNLSRRGKRHSFLHHADNKAASDIDDGNNDARDSVAANKLAGTVHRSIKIGLLRDFFPASLSFFLIDNARIHVGIDCHLPARHSIQGKAGGHFTDACRPLRDHHKLNHDDDHEDDYADDKLIARHEFAKRLDDAASRQHLVMPAMRQNQPRASYVQYQSAQSRGQQHRREDIEFQRRANIDGRQQHDHRQGDIRRQQHIEHRRRQRNDDDQHAGDQRQRQHQVLPAGKTRHAMKSSGSGTIGGCRGLHWR